MSWAKVLSGPVVLLAESGAKLVDKDSSLEELEC
jgi:hypothetical protein